MKLEEIENMQVDRALGMLNYAVTREARRDLLKLNMMDYPNASVENRKRLYTAIKEKINVPQQMKTTRDLMGFLNGK